MPNMDKIANFLRGLGGGGVENYLQRFGISGDHQSAPPPNNRYQWQNEALPGAGMPVGLKNLLAPEFSGKVKTFGSPVAANETVVPKSVPDEETMDKVATKTIDVGEPVVIKASAVPPVELAKQIRAAGNNPVIIQDASDLGFSSDEVVVVNRGKGKSKVKPEDALNSVETPVLKTSDFVDTMAFIRKGMGGQ